MIDEAQVASRPTTAPATPGRTRRSWLPGGPVVLYVVLALLLVLIVFPVAILVLGSFLGEPPRALHIDLSGLGVQHYRDVLTDPSFWSMTGTTLGACVAGTVGALLVGATLAVLSVRTDIWGRRILNAAAIMPMFVSPLVGAFAWDILGSPSAGILNVLLRAANLPGFVNSYSLPGIVFVFTIYYAPYVYLMISSALRNMDPTYEEASLISGASMPYTMWRVSLRLVWPALLSASLLVFVLLIQLFSIPAVLGTAGKHEFISIELWKMLTFAPPKSGQASALGVLLLLVTVLLVAVQNRILRGRSYVTVSGRTAQPRRIPLGKARPILTVLVLLYIIVSVVLPYAGLALMALRQSVYYQDLATLIDPSQFSFTSIEMAFSDPQIVETILNTALVAVGCMVLGLVLYFTVSYLTKRTRLRGRGALEYVAILPVAMPGLVIGLGYLWAWITLPIGIYGTLWILIFAYVSQFSPQGVKTISGSLVQIHPELEESSRICGASFLYTIRRVVAPLTRHGMVAAGTLILVLSVREIAVALFLYTSNSGVLSVVMFSYWERGSVGLVAVLAMFQAAVLAVVVIAGQVFGREAGVRRSSSSQPAASVVVGSGVKQ